MNEIFKNLMLNYDDNGEGVGSASLSSPVDAGYNYDFVVGNILNGYRSSNRNSGARQMGNVGVEAGSFQDNVEIPGGALNYDDDSDMLLKNLHGDYNAIDGAHRFTSDNGLDNPFFVKKMPQNGLSRLFLSADPNDVAASAAAYDDAAGEFTTDTKIDFLGGLTIWQLTAILIAVFMFLGEFYFYQIFTECLYCPKI